MGPRSRCSDGTFALSARNTGVRRWVLPLVAIVAVSCGSTLREQGSQAGAAPAAPSPTATAGHPSGSPSANAVRLTDDSTGVSIDMPRGWYHEEMRRPAIRFIRSYDASLSGDAVIPPSGGVMVRVEVLQDMGMADLEAFASRHVWIATCLPCRRIVERGQLAIGGEDALFFSVWQSQPPLFSDLEPSLFWLIRSPFLTDRVVVVRATPGASPLRAQVEQMVATIQFYKPAPPDLRPTRTRQQVIDQIRSNSGYNLTRIEAKLVLMSDWARAIESVGPATGPRLVYGANTDPNEVVWVVAFTGSGFTPMKGPPPPGPGATFVARTPVTWGWAVRVMPARAPYDWGGPFLGGPESIWPAYFDQLVDRDP
jgi:hypothetical protein